MELVVAKYHEDVSWLDRFRHVRCTVYDKSGAAGKNALPNVGREAHTYLHHILSRYEDLSETTVFLQGDPMDHVADLDEQVWSLERGVGYRDLSDHILVEDGNGEPVHPGLGAKQMYEELMGAPAPEHYMCHSGACFAVSKETIRTRPRAFYEHAMQLVLSRPLGPWEIERLWQYIFEAKPIREGLVTAADARFFRDLQFLVNSHRQRDRFPLIVFDLGLHPEQCDWCSAQTGVGLVSVPPIYKPVESIKRRHWWQTWLKPFYIYHAPLDRVLWIDADCVIVGELSHAFGLLDEAPLLVRDGTDVVTENHPVLYENLPLPDGRATNDVNLNAGVVGLCKLRDRPLLNAWAFGVAWAAMHPERQKLSAWADQGMLLWAAHRTDSVGAIRHDLGWNFPAQGTNNLILRAVRNQRSILDEIRCDYPGANIVHWLGRRKLSEQLVDELQSLFVDGFRNGC